jgi:hypothetical protein
MGCDAQGKIVNLSLLKKIQWAPYIWDFVFC